MEFDTRKLFDFSPCLGVCSACDAITKHYYEHERDVFVCDCGNFTKLESFSQVLTKSQLRYVEDCFYTEIQRKDKVIENLKDELLMTNYLREKSEQSKLKSYIESQSILQKAGVTSLREFAALAICIVAFFGSSYFFFKSIYFIPSGSFLNYLTGSFFSVYLVLGFAWLINKLFKIDVFSRIKDNKDD